ncbi:MAG: CrcB family protein [Actinobacteria bacterium]|jgi:CrcB protein|nr:CrcB family protein [Actinomycetota bacterium]
MSTVLLISVGAFLGAPLRYLIDHQFRRRFSFPGGILLVNLAGSFLLGVISKASDETLALLGVGFAGAFTTWSAFALDLDRDRTHPRRFLGNIFATLILGILAAGLGRALGS